MSPPALSNPSESWRDSEDPQLQKDAREYFKNREWSKLPGDVVHLYDLVWSQKRELDRKDLDILELRAELEKDRRSMFKHWVVTIGYFFALLAALIRVFWH